MQRGIFWPTPGQNHEEVTLVGNSIHISLSYRCLHLVCVQSTLTMRSLSSTSLQTGFCPATWFYFIFVIVAFNKSLLWCIRVDNDICTWIVIAHVKKCLDFVFVFLKWMEMVFFFSRSLSVRKNAHTVLVYRDDTHNIIDCLNKSLYLLLSKTLIEINILYFSLTSNTLMSVIMTLYKWASNSAESQVI